MVASLASTCTTWAPISSGVAVAPTGYPSASHRVNMSPARTGSQSLANSVMVGPTTNVVTRSQGYSPRNPRAISCSAAFVVA